MIQHNPTSNAADIQPSTSAAAALSGSSSFLTFQLENAKTHVIETVSMNVGFKIHLYIALAILAINYGIWFILCWQNIGLYPWWIPLAGGFAFTLTLHYWITVATNRDRFTLHASFFAIINTLCFLLWLIGGEFAVVWHLYTLETLALPLAIHYIFAKSGSTDRAWLVHLAWFTYVNTICFTIWLDTRSVPWPFFVLFGIAMPLLFHYWKRQPAEQRSMFDLHVMMYVDLQLLLFFIWATTGSDTGPWFGIVFAAMSLLVFVHWQVTQRKTAIVIVTTNNGTSTPPPSTGKHETSPVMQQQQQPMQQSGAVDTSNAAANTNNGAHLSANPDSTLYPRLSITHMV